ncbi:uncharacterized protein CLAFUR5_10668 [Fulvia fulva]|uniref:Uncharacterized protein n=1 Tax=Passalora fulva TaxID=5499 RepID=A0A9Q8PCH5_PASFU|nr:uncharacterized protein CLAFUR5_10668 [Fulvia fulva]KAK4620967.1 hypothetical protein CLAFUR0_11637 [Fulvia fulva]UJO20024.1 hypothetical protein CLAFUR5_10668 [Fulvia fulva]WPV32566.1 hypothetical protein CLAFUW7_11627 [Fulvia fulva]
MSDDAWAIPGFGAPRAQREEALERLDTVVGEHVTLCLQASAISSWQVVQPKHLSPSINIIEQERMMYQGLKQQRQGEIETSRSRLDLYFAWLWKLEDDVMGYVIRVTDRLHKDIRTHREAYKPVDRDQRARNVRNKLQIPEKQLEGKNNLSCGWAEDKYSKKYTEIHAQISTRLLEMQAEIASADALLKRPKNFPTSSNGWRQNEKKRTSGGRRNDWSKKRLER